MDETRQTPGPVIVMYTQAFCAYCAAARKLLRRKGVEFEEIDVTMNAEQRREMTTRSGGQTVPQIFIDDRPVGGYDDIVRLDRDGKLDALLGIEP